MASTVESGVLAYHWPTFENQEPCLSGEGLPGNPTAASITAHVSQRHISRISKAYLSYLKGISLVSQRHISRISKAYLSDLKGICCAVCACQHLWLV